MVYVPTLLLCLAALGWYWFVLRPDPVKKMGPGLRPAPTDIDRVEAFADLSGEEREEVTNLLDLLEVPAETTIIQEDHGDDSLYFLLQGAVTILKYGTVNNTRISEIQPGEFFGEMAFLTGRRRIASARTVKDCRILRISRSQFPGLTTLAEGLDEQIRRALDLHTIYLCSADTEALRPIAQDGIRRWARSSRVVTAVPNEQVPVSTGFPWIALTMGRVTLDGHIHEAPDLFRLDPGSSIISQTNSRLCLLDEAGRHSGSGKRTA